MACSTNVLGPDTTILESDCSIGTTNYNKKTIVIEDTKFVDDYKLEECLKNNTKKIEFINCDFLPIDWDKLGFPPWHRHDKKPIVELVNFLNKIPSIKNVEFYDCLGFSDIKLLEELKYVNNLNFVRCNDLKDISKIKKCELKIQDCTNIEKFPWYLKKKQDNFIKNKLKNFLNFLKSKMNYLVIDKLIKLNQELVKSEDKKEEILSRYIYRFTRYSQGYEKCCFNENVFLDKMSKFISKKLLDFNLIINEIDTKKDELLKEYNDHYGDDDDNNVDDYPSDDYPYDDYSSDQDYPSDEDILLVDPGCESDPGYIAHKQKYRIPGCFHY